MKLAYPIPDQRIIAHLTREYGLPLDQLHFIPMGDSAYSYKVLEESGQAYYLKLFDCENDRHQKSVDQLDGYLALTQHLYDTGNFVYLTAPLKGVKGSFYTRLGKSIVLALFQYIEGDTLASAYPLSKEMVEEIAKSLSILHYQVSPKLNREWVGRETYQISFSNDLRAVLADLEKGGFSNPSHHALQNLVIPRKDEIISLLSLLEELAIRVQDKRVDQVVCHGDVWGGNVIRSEKNQLFFIDWEGAVWAPAERDLFNYIGDEFEWFFPSYQRYAPERVWLSIDCLRFYAYRHHLQNLCNWIQNILYRNREEEQTRNDLEMIDQHCMNRWDAIEPNLLKAKEIMLKNDAGGSAH